MTIFQQITEHQRVRTGLTAVELLAATTLAAMLMVAVLGVLQSVTRGKNVLLAGIDRRPWEDRLLEAIRWDLRNSRSIRTAPDGIYLEGFASRDSSNGMTTHGPTLIRYYQTLVDDVPALLREESHIDSRNLANTSTNLLAFGIEQLRFLEATSKQDASQDVETDGEPISFPDGPLPEKVSLSITFADDDKEPRTHAIRLR